MNDFTKEELDTLYIALRHWEIKRYGGIFLESDLLKKLSSMIDNFHCEHEYSPTGALNVPLHCLKCGEKFE